MYISRYITALQCTTAGVLPQAGSEDHGEAGRFSELGRGSGLRTHAARQAGERPTVKEVRAKPGPCPHRTSSPGCSIPDAPCCRNGCAPPVIQPACRTKIGWAMTALCTQATRPVRARALSRKFERNAIASGTVAQLLMHTQQNRRPCWTSRPNPPGKQNGCVNDAAARACAHRIHEGGDLPGSRPRDQHTLYHRPLRLGQAGDPVIVPSALWNPISAGRTYRSPRRHQ